MWFQKRKERQKVKLAKFVIQKHNSSRLHYDFRLEKDGVLKSWAVPKGLSIKKDEKKLAIEMSDHDLDYVDFEGEIPEGFYGAGSVVVWDRGKYSIISWKDDFIKIDLVGEKVKGIYCLRKINKDWLIWKVE
jgi:DNA ligase D-like protein (predicted 3'-phosphoesterase)